MLLTIGKEFPAALVRFLMLQFLDIASTLVFLARGVEEANPLVKFSMDAVHNNVAGLLIVQLAAIPLALACLHFGRVKLLERMNRFFTLLVIWNFVAFLVSYRIH